jgi:hypothetical protein
MQSDLLMFIQLGQSCATAIDKETFQGNSMPVTGLQNKALPMTGRDFASKPNADSGLHARVNVSDSKCDAGTLENFGPEQKS